MTTAQDQLPGAAPAPGSEATGEGATSVEEMLAEIRKEADREKRDAERRKKLADEQDKNATELSELAKQVTAAEEGYKKALQTARDDARAVVDSIDKKAVERAENEVEFDSSRGSEAGTGAADDKPSAAQGKRSSTRGQTADQSKADQSTGTSSGRAQRLLEAVKDYEKLLDEIPPLLLEPCTEPDLPPPFPAKDQPPGADAASTAPPAPDTATDTTEAATARRPQLLGRQVWAATGAKEAVDNFKRVAGRAAVVTAKSKELREAKGKYDSNLHADTGDSDLALVSLVNVARLAYRLGIEEARFSSYVEDLKGRDNQRFVSAEEYRRQLEHCYTLVHRAKKAVLSVNDDVLTSSDKEAENQQKLAVLQADPLAEILRLANRHRKPSPDGGSGDGGDGGGTKPDTGTGGYDTDTPNGNPPDKAKG